MGKYCSVHCAMKYAISFCIMAVSFVFLPWWGTFVLAVLLLLYTPGYIALLFMILLDFYALPQEFPYASGIFVLCMLAAYVMKDRMFDGVE